VAWPDLRDGLTGTVTVSDAEVAEVMRLGVAWDLELGESGAAAPAGFAALVRDPACSDLRRAAGVSARSSVLMVATEGPTDQDSYHQAIQ
jgi:diaminopropionate ammonia-lyase